MLPQELTDAQQKAWASFEQDPLARADLDFSVIEGQAYLDELKAVDARQKLDVAEQPDRHKQLRSAWHQTGRFSLKRLGRQTALAAGAALVHGVTTRVVLSGGRTKPSWVEGNPDTWPSEAELMADIIKRNFGEPYIRKYGQPIDTVLDLEPAATNTLENIVFSINRFPTLIDRTTRVGLLSADHHLARCALIAERFQIDVAPEARISAQRTLLSRAATMQHSQYRKLYEDIASFTMDVERNLGLQALVRGELRYVKGLTEDEYLSYWIGYVFKLENPSLIQAIVSRIVADPGKAAVFAGLVTQVGFEPDAFRKIDLEELAATNHERYLETRRKLELLTRHRLMPPP